MIPDLSIRPLTLGDVDALVDLHRAAAAGPGGLARRPEEIDAAFVAAFVAKAGVGGVARGAWSGPQLVGDIHVVRMGIAQFAHVLTDLTVAVHPDWQGRGVGTRLFAALSEAAARMSPPITRIELMVREGNGNAVRLYERLGFRIEGRFEGRVRLPDGRLEADLAMGRLIVD